MIRRQLNDFLKDEDKNICEMRIKKLTSSSIILGVFGHTISLRINDDRTFTIESDDKALDGIVNAVNDEMIKERRISVVLEKFDEIYSEKILLTPSLDTPSVDQAGFPSANGDDDDDDGVEDDEEDDDGVIDMPDSSELMSMDHEDEDEDLFLSVNTLQQMDRQRKVISENYQRMFQKTKASLTIGDTVKKMTSSSGTDWKTKKCEIEMSLDFYEDGFVVNKDGKLRDRDDRENKKILDEFEKGKVPNQFNKTGAVRIDCHVFLHQFKFADRNDEEKTHMGISGNFKEFEGEDVDRKRLEKQDWYCGKCTAMNKGKNFGCEICNERRPRCGYDVKQGEPFFNCRACTAKNQKTSKCCAVCGVGKIDDDDDDDDSVGVVKKKEEEGEEKKTTKPVVKEKWSCPSCTFANIPFVEACEMCGLPRYGQRVPVPSGGGGDAADVKEVIEDDFVGYNWACQECTYANKPSLGFCAVCSSKKPDDL